MEVEKDREFREIEGFPEYKIDKFGNVIRKSDGYQIPWFYPAVQIKDSKGKIKKPYVHKLVAETFIEKPDSKEELIIGHKDDDKQNPCADNLHWITRSQNNTDAYRNNRKRIDDGYRSNAKPVLAKSPKGEVQEFGGIRLAARELGLQSVAISLCCKGKQNNTQGWRFKYKNTTTDFPELQIRAKYNAKKVKQYDLNDNLIRTYNSAKEAAASTGALVAKISSVCHGTRKTAGGFKWKFVEES